MKRSLSAALALGVAAAVLAPSQGAQAFESDVSIDIKLNQKITLERPPIQGVSTVFQSSSPNFVPLVPNGTVQECRDEPVGCEVIPLTLNVPQDEPEALEAAGYILTVVIDYDPGQQVQNVPEVGDLRQNDLQGFLFQDPPITNSRGTASFTARTSGADPGTMIAVNPTSKQFFVVVANYSGVNTGYTVQVDLATASGVIFDPKEPKPGDKPKDFVQPTFTPPGTTPRDSGFGGAGNPPAAPPAPGAGPSPAVPSAGAIVVPNVAEGDADPKLLAMSSVTVTSGLGRKAIDKIESKVTERAVEKSGTGKVVLSLLVLPILAAVVALLLLRRRKKDAAPVALPA